MNATFEKSSDGDCYRCPACNSVIAHVCAKEQPPTIEEMRQQIPGVATAQKIVSAIELRAGYIFSKGNNAWIKPGNARGFLTGQDKRQQRQWRKSRLEWAKQQGDVATVVDQEMTIKRGLTEKVLSDASLVLFSDSLPAVVCHKPGCGEKTTIPSVRSVI